MWYIVTKYIHKKLLFFNPYDMQIMEMHAFHSHNASRAQLFLSYFRVLRKHVKRVGFSFCRVLFTSKPQQVTMATTNNGIVNGIEEQEEKETEQEEEQEEEVYRNFVALHAGALRSSGIPELYWKSLFLKLSQEVWTPRFNFNSI